MTQPRASARYCLLPPVVFPPLGAGAGAFAFTLGAGATPLTAELPVGRLGVGLCDVGWNPALPMFTQPPPSFPEP